MKSVVWIVAFISSFANAQSSAQMDAFNSGQDAGKSATQGMFSNINTSTGSNTVSGFSQTPPPQSSYWGGQNTVINNMYTGGNSTIAACQSGTPASGASDQQHCAAVNSIMNSQATQPANLISKSDPLMLKGKTIGANPEAIAGAIDGNYSNCTTSQKAKDPTFTMQTCEDWSQSEGASCTMGQSVVVDPDYIYKCSETLSTLNNSTCTYGVVVQVKADYKYQCLKTDYAVTTQTCNRKLTVQANTVPGCTPGTFITRVTADPCPWCYDYIAHDYYCQNGYYQMHVFTINRYSGGVNSDLGWANVAGSPGTYIPQTQGVSSMTWPWCYITYYSQSCSATTCTMQSWFTNPCQGTSSYGQTSFAMPTTTAFVDVWSDQCSTLAGRAK